MQCRTQGPLYWLAESVHDLQKQLGYQERLHTSWPLVIVAVGYIRQTVARGNFWSQLVFLLPVPQNGAKRCTWLFYVIHFAWNRLFNMLQSPVISNGKLRQFYSLNNSSFYPPLSCLQNRTSSWTKWIWIKKTGIEHLVSTFGQCELVKRDNV